MVHRTVWFYKVCSRIPPRRSDVEVDIIVTTSAATGSLSGTTPMNSGEVAVLKFTKVPRHMYILFQGGSACVLRGC